VEIFDPRGGPEGKVVESRRLVNDDYDARTARLIAPATPGEYVVRYWSGEGRAVLATTPITVEAAEVGLTAPDSVDMGAAFEVAWTGPGANRDTVELFDPADGPDGKEIGGQRLVNGDYANRTVSLLAPVRPGSYLLRYWNADNRTVLATRPLTVIATAVSVSGPGSVAAGARFDVIWAGPGANRDSIEVFDAGAGKVVAARRLINDDYAGRKATLKAPDAPGQYALRYWSGDGRAVLAEEALTVQ
jgi:Ca-activated chloride channel family protein